jgi:hypothetical protein
MRGEGRGADAAVERLGTIVRKREWNPQVTVGRQTPPSPLGAGGRVDLAGKSGARSTSSGGKEGQPGREPHPHEGHAAAPLIKASHRSA